MACLFVKLIQVSCILAIGTSLTLANELENFLREYEVIPDVISTAPSNFLKVSYENGLTVNHGNELTPTQVKTQPNIDWQGESDSYYTLIMTDPDAPSRSDPKFREFNHWLVGNIPGNDLARGEVIRAYVGSGPPKDTGLHRYVFLLYKQTGKLVFDEVQAANNSRNGRPNFRTAEFADKYGLGAPIAANFYQAQYDDYVPILHKQLSAN